MWAQLLSSIVLHLELFFGLFIAALSRSYIYISTRIKSYHSGNWPGSNFLNSKFSQCGSFCSDAALDLRKRPKNVMYVYFFSKRLNLRGNESILMHIRIKKKACFLLYLLFSEAFNPNNSNASITRAFLPVTSISRYQRFNVSNWIKAWFFHVPTSKLQLHRNLNESNFSDWKFSISPRGFFFSIKLLNCKKWVWISLLNGERQGGMVTEFRRRKEREDVSLRFPSESSSSSSSSPPPPPR